MSSRLAQCRACLSADPYLFLPLGMHPPANAFLRADQLEEAAPQFSLDTYACLSCALVQIPDCIPPDFYRHYLYIPSASTTMAEHFSSMAGDLKSRFLDSPESLLVDIGCNDGLFLNAAHDLGVRTLGIDPATNIVEFAAEKGLTVVNEYFTPETAASTRDAHGPASVITTTNTFNHINDLHGFMKAVDILLDEQGVFVIEVPQAIEFIERNEFDTIYHEHLSVFSVQSLVALYRSFGLRIFDIQPLPVHGGSMRVFARRSSDTGAEAEVVRQYLAREQENGLFERRTYDTFAASVSRIRTELLELLQKLREDGKVIVGYGAPAKGNTLLIYYGLGPDTLGCLLDKSPLKQGLFSPGTHIPIASPDTFDLSGVDYMLILAWNFADEIMEQQDEFRRRGGKFILPIPSPTIVG